MSIIPTTAFPRSLLKPLFLVGDTPLTALQSDPRFSYRTYIPDSHYPETSDSEKKLPVLVSVHGAGRRPGRYIDAWRQFADTHGVVIVAPLFPAGVTGPLDLDGYHFLGKQPAPEGKFVDLLWKQAVPNPAAPAPGTGKAEIRHDLVLLAMLDEIALRWPVIDTSKFYLVGFSGGGQFAHRFMYLHPERLLGACVGAPGSVTHLDFDEEWPSGVKDYETVFGHGVEIEKLKKVPVLCVVGEDDIKGHGSQLAPMVKGKKFGSAEEEAKMTRVGRAAKLVINWKGAGLCADFEVVKGAGHEMEKCAPNMVGFMTRLIEGTHAYSLRDV